MVQPDGKIIIGGGYVKNGIFINSIFRLNSDGSKDTGFNPGIGAKGTILSVSYQPDGKIIIGGYFEEFNGTAINNIARLNSDGSLDTSFNPGNSINGGVWATSIQADGKILVGGTFLKTVIRLNTDGSLDTSFNPSVNNIFCLTITVQPNGKIIIGGNYSGSNNPNENAIQRLNSDGSLDTSFNSGIGPDGSIYTTSIQSDGKIIIGGDFDNYNGTKINSIASLKTDGTLDTNFNPGTSINPLSVIKSSIIQLDGKIIIGGDFTSYNDTGRNRIARLEGDDNLNIIDKKTDSAKLTLFPNPTKNILKVSNTIELQGKKFSIIDFSGKEIFKGRVTADNIIDIRNLSNGLYLLKIENEFTGKFIKE